jgi:hypothetical protein
MAIVKYSSSINELRGKVGGGVFQRCGQSLSLRSNLYHKVPVSENFVESQNIMARLAAHWRTLTWSQRDTFRQYASTYPTVDRFGDPVVLNPYQLFIYLCRPLVFMASPLPTAASYYVPSSLCESFVNAYVDIDPLMYINYGHDISPYVDLLVYMSATSLNLAGLSKSKVKLIAAVSGPESNPQNVISNYIEAYPGTAFVESYLYYDSYLVNKVTGQKTRDTFGNQYLGW